MRRFVGLSVIATAAVVAPATARAHFTLDQLDDAKPVSWMSQDSTGGPQKTGPCAAMANAGLGDSMGTPTHIVTGLMAGETVKITVTATVPHPGWYRIALMEGAAASQSLTTIPDPMAMSGTNCTPAIMTNPVWSKTQPVIADGLPAGSTAKTMQSGTKVLTATIPQNASCTTAAPCTIQVIMVMTDHPANDCYYHHCADITTAGGGNGDGGTMDASTGMPDGGMSMGGGSAMGGAAAGGAKGSGGMVGTGGAAASGGMSGTGGASATGGANASASGGSTATGGTSSSSGGVTASGGKSGSGGSSASGGSSSSSGGSAPGSGGTTMAASGGSSGTGASGSSGGCSAIPDGGGGPLLAGGASLLALLLARARRSRRK